MDVKIIANYLPQFHETPYNNEWWGEGFTDWVSVKNAKSVCSQVKQPKVPLDNHYYSLNEVEEVKWQAKLAKEYGVYGFGIYHYWFSSEQCLLDTPVKLILENKDIDIPFLLIWDNVSWKRSWDAVRFSNDWAPLYEKDEDTDGATKKSGMLAELKYGDEKEWLAHFKYLLPFLQDSRYIKVGNKPVFAVFNQDNEPEILAKMINYWDEQARLYGFDGIEIWGKKNNRNVCITAKEFLYEPHEHGWVAHNIFDKARNRLDKRSPKLYDYDEIWNRILISARKNKDSNCYYSAYVGYDDTPRRGRNSRIVLGSQADKFGKYLSQLLQISRDQNKEFLFLTAWNEWGEGAYLEPDEEHKYTFLESVKSAVERNQ